MAAGFCPILVASSVTQRAESGLHYYNFQIYRTIAEHWYFPKQLLFLSQTLRAEPFHCCLYNVQTLLQTLYFTSFWFLKPMFADKVLSGVFCTMCVQMFLLASCTLPAASKTETLDYILDCSVRRSTWRHQLKPGCHLDPPPYPKPRCLWRRMLLEDTCRSVLIFLVAWKVQAPPWLRWSTACG